MIRQVFAPADVRLEVYEQLGLLLLAFFVWRHIETQKSAQPDPAVSTVLPTVSSRSAEGSSIARSKPSDPSADSGKAAQSSSRARVSPSDGEKVAEVIAEKQPNTDEAQKEKSRPSAKPQTVDDLTPEQRQKYLEAQAKRRQAPGKAIPSSSRPDKATTPKIRKLEDLTAEEREKYEGAKARQESAETAPHHDATLSPRQKTFDDLSPEDQEKYRKAKSMREHAREKETPRMREKPVSDERGERELREKSGVSADVEKKPKRMDELTPEEKERYIRAREKRKRMEMAAKKPGEGSGLSTDEKDRLGH